MFILFDFFYLLLIVIYLPAYIFRRKFHPGFIRRFGVLPKAQEFDRPIWIHAVSVGEAMVARGLVEELRRQHPHKQFVFSTVTATGNKIASMMVAGKDFLTYLPFDFSFIIGPVIKKVNPSVFILVETEIWPNLIRVLRKKDIPVITVNGRISDASFKGYAMVRPLVGPALEGISLFCVQTEADLLRLSSLGVAKEKIKVAGNMKFDSKDSLGAASQTSAYRRKLGLTSQEKLIVCGSTHPQEEKLLLEAYKRLLLTKATGARLLLAPRHPERSREVELLVRESGFIPQRITGLADKEAADTHPVFILDTIGNLMYFYAAADVVFVGGSLIKKGGHNILEPASLGKPIVFGPHMFNFREIAELFLKNRAAIIVRDQEEIKDAWGHLLYDASLRAALVERAQKLFAANQGATARTARFINGIIG